MSKTVYRDGEVKDVEYETPKKPWHKSAAWFIWFGVSGATAWASWNVASYCHGLLSGNAFALGVLSSCACLVTGSVAAVKKWGIK
jgi:hypothetical protein